MTNERVKALEKEVKELRAQQEKLQKRKGLEDKVKKLKGEVRSLKLRKVINVGKAIKRAFTSRSSKPKAVKVKVRRRKVKGKKKRRVVIVRRVQALRPTVTQPVRRPVTALEMINRF